MSYNYVQKNLPPKFYVWLFTTFLFCFFFSQFSPSKVFLTFYFFFRKKEDKKWTKKNVFDSKKNWLVVQNLAKFFLCHKMVTLFFLTWTFPPPDTPKPKFLKNKKFSLEKSPWICTKKSQKPKVIPLNNPPPPPAYVPQICQTSRKFMQKIWKFSLKKHFLKKTCFWGTKNVGFFLWVKGYRVPPAVVVDLWSTTNNAFEIL